MQNLKALSDNELLTRAQILVKKERELLAVFLEHLVEIDTRRLYERGYSSLFCYLTKELGYSDSAAGRRVFVARLCARVPRVLEAIRQGQLHLCGANRLANVISADNAEEIIQAAAGKSMGEIDQILVRYAPRPVVRDGITKQASDAKSLFAVTALTDDQPVVVAVPQPKRDELKPATPDVFNIRFAAKKAFVEKLERAQELLSSSTDGSYEEILEKTLDAYLAKHDPLLQVAKTAPKSSKPEPSRSRYIPKSVRTIVMQRDLGYCTHVDSRSGRRCDARHHIQIDHVIPFARGGSSKDPDNLRLLCATHNLSAARDVFGADYIAAKFTPTGGSGLDFTPDHGAGHSTSTSAQRM